ncbi:hypothetical protein ACES2J_12505 [Bdellovibrio bacteriovorus]|uniref:hypothetical protein n=1 Tax=Bdellovibrio bacteriovorus TaxID=959 RepID=UPI0035A58783
MFARWKSQLLRKSLRHRGSPKHAYYAIIVEAYKKDGRPAQRLVRYIGGIREQDLNSPFHRKEFWERADRIMAEMNLAPQMRSSFEQKFAAKVPRPSRSELLAEINGSLGIRQISRA